MAGCGARDTKEADDQEPLGVGGGDRAGDVRLGAEAVRAPGVGAGADVPERIVNEVVLEARAAADGDLGRDLRDPAAHRLADALGASIDYLMEGPTEEAAKAHFEVRELLRQFQKVEDLPDDDKLVVKKLLDAFLTKKQILRLAG